MIKKISLFFFVAILLTLSVAAMAESNEASGTVIEFWHLDIDDTMAPVWQGFADEFMEMNPGVTIEITVLENEAFKSKVKTVMQSGDPPDIFRSWGGGVMNDYAKAGLLRDITKEVKNNWSSEIGAGPIGVYSYKDKIYGLPYDMGGVGMWYNKELLAKVGYNEPPKTWANFIDCVKKLKAAGIIPIALGEGDKWPGHFWWVYLAVRLGGKEAFDAAIDRSGSFKSPSFVRAGQLLKELVDLEPFQEGFLSANYGGDQAGLMGNGKAAFELMGQWAPAVEKAASESGDGIGDKLGFMAFPAVEGGKGKITDVMGGGNGFVIGKNAPDATIEFLKYLTSVETQKKIITSPIGGIPTAKGAEVAMTDPNLLAVNKAVSQAGYFQLYYDQYLPPAVAAVVLDSTQALFAGTKTPEEVAAAIDEAYVDEL